MRSRGAGRNPGGRPVKGGVFATLSLALVLGGLAADPAVAARPLIGHRTAALPWRLPAPRPTAKAGEPSGTLTQAAFTHRLGSLDRTPLDVGRGDTLMDMLVQAGASTVDADAALRALRTVYDPRSLKPGVTVNVLTSGPKRAFAGLSLEPTADTVVAVTRNADGAFVPMRMQRPLHLRMVAARAVIQSSLFEDGSTAGIPVPVMTELVKLYSYDVDFQRDIQPGDQLDVLYERYVTDGGNIARDGKILYAALSLNGEVKRIFHFKVPGGTDGYYDQEGHSVQKALLRTPVDSVRITSSFGMRHHPILGYSRMHKGVDFGAPAGTPIFAAGNGRIVTIGREGEYGNYVRIEHNPNLATAYAHMSRFVRGEHKGEEVHQGEIIGYVGQTGLATGPHLHFEVLVDGRQVNPMSVKNLPTGRTLTAGELGAFHHEAQALVRTFDTTRAGTLVASRPDAQPTAPQGD